ncbi:transposase [Mycoplasmoides gallisepticum]|nr:transposase [Mycoplasmoides gallisepticum]QEX46367.1 transposase [Mycoplasmoides gallisepticum]
MSETCIIVSDGLKGLKEAIENVYPKAMHITCTVHMIRNAAKYLSHSMKSDFLRDLKKHIWSRQLRKCKTQLWIFKK